MAAREAPVGAIGGVTIGSLFAVALLWLFRPGYGGCAAPVALPPDGGCFSYTDSRIAIAGTILTAILFAGFVVVGFRAKPPARLPVLIVLGVLILAVLITCVALAFSNPLPIPEGVFP